jgi:hypothetical protein
MHRLVESRQRQPMRNHRRQINAAIAYQRLCLKPRLVHLAAVDAKHCRALEDQRIRQVYLHRPRRNPQQRRSPAHPQQPEPLLNRRRMPRHLQQHIHAIAAGPRPSPAAPHRPIPDPAAPAHPLSLPARAAAHSVQSQRCAKLHTPSPPQSKIIQSARIRSPPPSAPLSHPTAPFAPHCQRDRTTMRSRAESPGRASRYCSPESAHNPRTRHPHPRQESSRTGRHAPCPLRHCRQCPHATCISAVTKSPTLTPCTCSPTAAHSPAKFMPRNIRRLDARLRPFIPVVDVQIRTAHRRGLHRNEYIRRSNLRHRHLAHLHPWSRSGLHERTHSIWNLLQNHSVESLFLVAPSLRTSEANISWYRLSPGLSNIGCDACVSSSSNVHSYTESAASDPAHRL